MGDGNGSDAAMAVIARPEVDQHAPPPLGATELVFDPSWRSFSAIQGGLLVGHMLSAAVTAAAEPTSSATDAGRSSTVARAVTAHLLAPVRPDRSAVVSVKPDRTGSTSSIRVEIRQRNALVALAQVLTRATPADRRGGTAPLPPAPTAPGNPADGDPFELPTDYVPVGQHLQIRALDGTRPHGTGTEPRLHAWVRVTAELPPLVALGVLADALPPSVFAVRAPIALATVELTAHLWGPPPPAGAWVRIDQRTAWMSQDVAVDDATLLDETGQLVCQVRQTRRVPRVDMRS